MKFSTRRFSRSLMLKLEKFWSIFLPYFYGNITSLFLTEFNLKLVKNFLKSFTVKIGKI